MARTGRAATTLVCTLVMSPVPAQEPYDFYGGDVKARKKNAAVEACEYDELVEKQRCNESLNKTACIAQVIEECAERFGDDAAERSPDPETPR